MIVGRGDRTESLDFGDVVAVAAAGVAAVCDDTARSRSESA